MKTKQRTQGIMIILQAIFSGHRQNSEDVQFKKICFLINTLRTLMSTALTATHKDVQLYGNLYVFSTVLIREKS